jgi:uncharacterized protein YndB with AHSA1/START domain
MTTTTAIPTTDTTLYMKRTFSVPRERVFDAWVNPELLQRWFAASKDYMSPYAEVDLKVGGRFRMAMKHVEKGNQHVATGLYKEIKRPEKLVFTWEWEGEPENGQTLVTVELREVEGLTEMLFKQEFFPNKERRDDHEKGWTGCFETLAGALQ